MSQTGVWTGLQPQGCGDTERFNSSSVARHPPATRRNCFCACWESNPGHKHGRLVCCHYTTCAHATRKNWKGARVFPLRSARNKYNSYTLQRTHPDDTLAEWLRRRPAKPMGSPRVGSNPTGVVFRITETAKPEPTQTRTDSDAVVSECKNHGGRKYRRCTWTGAAAAIAQLGERQTEDLKVPGSIPGLSRILCVVRLGY